MLSTNKLAVLAFATFVALQAPAYADDAVIAKVGTLEIHQSELDLAVANLDPSWRSFPMTRRRSQPFPPPST